MRLALRRRTELKSHTRPTPDWVMDLRDSYLAAFPTCQLAASMPWLLFRQSPQVDVGHIWPGSDSTETQEHWSNYATVGGAAQRWIHANPILGRIAILGFKYDLMCRTGNDRHFDISALCDAAGHDVLLWMESVATTDSMPLWARETAADVLQGH